MRNQVPKSSASSCCVAGGRLKMILRARRGERRVSCDGNSDSGFSRENINLQKGRRDQRCGKNAPVLSAQNYIFGGFFLEGRRKEIRSSQVVTNKRKFFALSMPASFTARSHPTITTANTPCQRAVHSFLGRPARNCRRRDSLVEFFVLLDSLRDIQHAEELPLHLGSEHASRQLQQKLLQRKTQLDTGCTVGRALHNEITSGLFEHQRKTAVTGRKQS